MKILRSHHSGIRVVDLERTLQFYVDVLGLKIAHEFVNTETGQRYGVFLDSGDGTYLEFFQRRDMRPSAWRDGPLDHICLEVADIETEMFYLRGRGYPIEGIRRGRTDHVLQFFVEDPDGLRVEIQEHDEESALFQYEVRRDG